MLCVTFALLSLLCLMPAQLFRFLNVDFAPYHVRTVHLIWMLESATTHDHVESIVAQSLTAPESRNVHEAYEAFGVFWRLTGQIYKVR